MPRKKRARQYSSPVREQRADETRTRIADAARTLFLANGFDGTTVDAIAREAGVAVPTVYAIFRSKRGLVEELLHRARFGAAYADLVQRAIAETDPRARVRFVARISRRVYDGERAELDFLRGAGMVSPDLGDAEEERKRYTLQKKTIDFLSDAGVLRSDLDVTTARDVLFAMTARDVYRSLVVVRGWDPAKYERWLGETLLAALVLAAPAVDRR